MGGKDHIVRLLSFWTKLSILDHAPLKPGLHISRKDRKHICQNMFFKLYSYGLVSMW